MATLTENLASSLVVTTMNNYSTKLRDTYFKKFSFLGRFCKAMRDEYKYTGKKFGKFFDGGRSYLLPITANENTTMAGYSNIDKIDTTHNDSEFENAQYFPRYVAGSVTLSDEDMDQNSGKAKLMKLAQKKMNNAHKSACKVLTQHLTADALASSKNFAGIPQYIVTTAEASQTSGTVGGITRNYNSGVGPWFNRVQTGGGSSFGTGNNSAGITKLRTLFNDCSGGSNGDNPDLLVSNSDSHELYETSLTTQERYVKDANKAIHDPGISANALLFKGVEYIWDSAFPALRIYMINTEYLYIIWDPKKHFLFHPPQRPTDQLASVSLFVTKGQLVCEGLNRQGVFHSFTA